MTIVILRNFNRIQGCRFSFIYASFEENVVELIKWQEIILNHFGKFSVTFYLSSKKESIFHDKVWRSLTLRMDKTYNNYWKAKEQKRKNALETENELLKEKNKYESFC